MLFIELLHLLNSMGHNEMVIEDAVNVFISAEELKAIVCKGIMLFEMHAIFNRDTHTSC